MSSNNTTKARSTNKAELPPVNPLSKLNIDLNTLTAKNKNQFAAAGENENNSQAKKFNNRPCDDYGRGAPTDRLTFGYAPSVPTEAVAFHSQFTAKEWKLERRLRYRNRCLRSRAVYFQEVAHLASGAMKTQKVLNFEPDTSAIKLRLYWIEKLEEEKRMLAGGDLLVVGEENNKNTTKNSNNKANTKNASSVVVAATNTSAAGTQPQKTSENNNKKDGNFGQLLSEMFGGEYSSTGNNNNNKESGKRRQRDE